MTITPRCSIKKMADELARNFSTPDECNPYLPGDPAQYAFEREFARAKERIEIVQLAKDCNDESKSNQTNI